MRLHLPITAFRLTVQPNFWAISLAEYCGAHSRRFAMRSSVHVDRFDGTAAFPAPGWSRQPTRSTRPL